MTDPGTYARLTALQEQLDRPTPPVLEGQQAIDLEDAPPHPQDPATQQTTLW